MDTENLLLSFAHDSSLITHHFLLVEQRLHAMKSGGSLSEVATLFERLAIVSGRVQIPLPHFVNPAQVKMRKGVGFIARRIERAFEPAHAAVGIAFR